MFVGPTSNEDRIRDLCARLLYAEDPGEINELAGQLRAELRSHVAKLRGMVAIHRRVNAETQDEQGDDSECA
jgi:hypothetical protein